MSKRMSRRILVITLIVLLIFLVVSDQRFWWWAADSHIPVLTAIHLYMAAPLWMGVLLHVFWLNRKPFFSFFKRAPNLSDRGVMQIIVLLLILLFLGVAVIESHMETGKPIPGTESLYMLLEPWWRWWFSACWAALIYHMWLNRKALFSHIGQRLTIAILALLSLAVILLDLTSAFVETFR
jgi:hypothetical protein